MEIDDKDEKSDTTTSATTTRHTSKSNKVKKKFSFKKTKIINQIYSSLSVFNT
jgi:hypothetical protein